jgi:hypothetical protein
MDLCQTKTDLMDLCQTMIGMLEMTKVMEMARAQAHQYIASDQDLVFGLLGTSHKLLNQLSITANHLDISHIDHAVLHTPYHTVHTVGMESSSRYISGQSSSRVPFHLDTRMPLGIWDYYTRCLRLIHTPEVDRWMLREALAHAHKILHASSKAA